MFTKNNPSSIQLMFDTIAKRYDITNWFISLGLHAIWNRRLVREVLYHIETKTKRSRSDSFRFLDVCCGTGEIAFRLASQLRDYQKLDITGLDFSTQMISIATERCKQTHYPNVNWNFIHGDATALPFNDSSFHIISMAYGIRNIENRLDSLQEMSRVLQPKGIVCILELTSPDLKILQKIHAWYLQNAIPFIGSWISGNKESYTYLSRSIKQFVHRDELVREMKKIFGDSQVEAHSILGGVATLFIGKKL